MKFAHLALGLFGVAVAQHSFAAPEVEIGGEYQFNVTYTDDGLNEPNEHKQTQLNFVGAKIALRGKLSDQISWNVLYKAKESELERWWLTNKVTDNPDVSVGKQKIKVNGLHRRLTSSVVSPITGSYLRNNPLTDKTALDITYKFLGTFSLQLVEDYVNCPGNGVPAAGTVTSTCTSWNEVNGAGATYQKQPATVLEWFGSFGNISPLLQYASYDLGKSNTASAGIRYKDDMIDTYLDATVDTRNARGAANPAIAEYREEETKRTGVVAYGEVKVGFFSPYLHLSSLSTDPYTPDTATEAQKTARETNAPGLLTNNEFTVAVGTHFENWGTMYRPFAQVVHSEGEYVDPDDTTKVEKKDFAKTDLVVGLIGKF